MTELLNCVQINEYGSGLVRIFKLNQFCKRSIYCLSILDKEEKFRIVFLSTKNYFFRPKDLKKIQGMAEQLAEHLEQERLNSFDSIDDLNNLSILNVDVLQDYGKWFHIHANYNYRIGEYRLCEMIMKQVFDQSVTYCKLGTTNHKLIIQGADIIVCSIFRYALDLLYEIGNFFEIKIFPYSNKVMNHGNLFTYLKDPVRVLCP